MGSNELQGGVEFVLVINIVYKQLSTQGTITSCSVNKLADQEPRFYGI